MFRHPDHAPADYDLRNDFRKLSINNFDLAKASGSALKNLFGQVGDVVLYWAHHEKLLVIDNRLAFMGGLDMCMLSWCIICRSDRMDDEYLTLTLCRLWTLRHQQ